MADANKRYRALLHSKRLLEDLCDPGKTPRVPGAVRTRAREVLRHLPNDLELERIENLGFATSDYTDAKVD